MLLSTRTMQMTLLRTRTMPNEVTKHKNKMQMKFLNTRTMPIGLAKHKNNANESAKNKHNGRRR